MTWSLRLGRLAGIPINVHWTFAILLAWVGIARVTAGATAAEVGMTFVLVAALFACVVLHELGHALAARRYGIGTRDITLLPIGGVARLERMPEDPTQELVVAAAGPMVNVAIAALLGLVKLAGVGGGLAEPDLLGPGLLSQLLYVNVALVLFNLLPAFPMDGGRMLRALLATQMSHVRATRAAAMIGQGMAVLFGLVGLLINPLLIFIALFVFLGAQAEASHAEVKWMLSGVSVESAMITRFRTLSVDDPLQHAVDLLISSEQQDFPVEEDGRLAGVLTRSGLLGALRSAGEDASIGEHLERRSDAVRPREMLAPVFERMRSTGRTAVPVVEGERIVGLLTTENVGEWMMVQSALGRDDEDATRS